MRRGWTLGFVALLVMGSSMVALAQITGEQVSEQLRKAHAAGGVQAVIETLRDLRTAHPDAVKTVLGSLLAVAADQYQKGTRAAATDLLEKAEPLFPDQAGLHAVLGQFYWYDRDRTKAASSFKRAVAIDPKHSTARKYLDVLFFVPDDFRVPDLLTTAHLRVRPIKASDAALDYRAVMSSLSHLKGVFGPDSTWPKATLTLDEDRRVLETHQDEFIRRSAFTYTVMDHKETICLGCVYIMPMHSDRYKAQVILWVTADGFTKGYDKELFQAVKRWLKDSWPFEQVAYPGREMDWKTYEAVQR